MYVFITMLYACWSITVYKKPLYVFIRTSQWQIKHLYVKIYIYMYV